MFISTKAPYRSLVHAAMSVTVIGSCLAGVQVIVAPVAHASAGCTSTTPVLGELISCENAGTEIIVVPAGAQKAVVVAKGAGGSGGTKNGCNCASTVGGAGGAGALVEATVPVSGVANLNVSVGAGGITPNPTYEAFAGRGGAATTLRDGATYLMVAGGGGGGGTEIPGQDGGNGGAGGEHGLDGEYLGGSGGNVTSPGAGGEFGIGAPEDPVSMGPADWRCYFINPSSYPSQWEEYNCDTEVFSPGVAVTPASSSFTGQGGSDSVGTRGGWGGDGYGGGGIGGWSGAGGGGGGGGSYVISTASSVTFTTGGGGAGGARTPERELPGGPGGTGSITLRFLGAPTSPLSVVATSGNSQATVTWASPASDGGSAITGYTVTSSPGGLTFHADASTHSLIAGGLTNDTSYTFTVAATNEFGEGNASIASNPVVPRSATPVVAGTPTLTPTPTPTPARTPSAMPGSVVVPSAGALTGAQMSAVTPEQLALFTASDVSALAPTVVMVMTPAQMAALPPLAFAGFTPEQAVQLSADQVRSIPAAASAELTPAALRALLPSTLRAFSADQGAALSAAQSRMMPPRSLVALSAHAMQAMPRSAVRAILVRAFARLSPAAATKLINNLGSDLSAAQLRALRLVLRG